MKRAVLACIAASLTAPCLGAGATVTRVIEAGETLREADLAPATGPDLPGAVDGTTIAGRQAARRLTPGRALLPYDLREALMVTRGDPVSITWEEGALRIGADGRALGNGAMGAPVRVGINNRVIEGRVVGAGQVHVGDRQ